MKNDRRKRTSRYMTYSKKSNKRFYKSKTILFNVCVVALASYRYINEGYDSFDIEQIALCLTASVNVLLRFITKEELG